MTAKRNFLQHLVLPERIVRSCLFNANISYDVVEISIKSRYSYHRNDYVNKFISDCQKAKSSQNEVVNPFLGRVESEM